MGNVGQFFQPPLYWQEFEELCSGLLTEVYDVPNAQQVGRPGQAQCGVDVFGKSPRFGRIAELYRIEAEIRGMDPGQRLSARQARSAPLIAAFGEGLHLQCRRISMRSRLGEKLAYIHRHWGGLQTFLRDGRVEIDSNNVENLIRPIALTRKNALFAGHDEGGRSWARIASLIATAKVNGVEPFAYLKATLEAVAASHPQAKIDDLLPWNFNPSS
uniref:IS66 family transposase n=1 Tax=Pseudogemmobacter bohemicus TaxID=2250708 RepID=UPI001E5DE27D|nr:transposase [Pseudogemmobacter bohemicus]